ncbi:hypothetical protein O181_067764 [Austropuccinia psidii MF-1]|uniref:Integrase catalytic domain-containing protein n=1 Tax=Austropuccinia psidii MF-1 TaxID=1389203 RepID=A0A9Q3EW06_9BASI|nr:hypothetical protein [Austropuccinia psidii MF-1]
MDSLTSLAPGGDRSFNASLVLVERYSKTQMFLPSHEDYIAMETYIMMWNRLIIRTCLFQNIISDRDPQFTSEIWKNIHNLLGTKLSLSKASHPQTDGSKERMIQTLEDMIRRFCCYGLELKDSYDFTHNWCRLLSALELAYKT